MHLQKSFSLGLLSTCMVISLGLVPVKVAAQGMPPVSTVTLQIVPGANGQESVLTPRGMVVPLPGPGVNSNAVQIYLGAQGGAWYVDKYNQNVDLSEALQRFRAMSGQAPMQQVPQYAPAPPVQYGNSGSNVAAAGMAAMGGAMAGAAMAGAYTNTPYGTPVYYPHGGSPYYVNANGNNVNVAHAYTGDSAAYYDAHATNLEKQQAYYEAQQHANSAQYQNWHKYAGVNPFVNQQAYAATAGAAAGAYHANEQGLYNPAAAGAAAGAYHANQQGFNNPAAAGAAAGAYHANEQGFNNPAAAGAAAGAHHENEQGFNNAAAGAAAGAHHENGEGVKNPAAAGAAAADSGGRRGRFRRGGGSATEASAADEKAGGRFGRGDSAGADGARDAADGGGRHRLRR